MKKPVAAINALLPERTSPCVVLCSVKKFYPGLCFQIREEGKDKQWRAVVCCSTYMLGEVKIAVLDWF